MSDAEDDGGVEVPAPIVSVIANPLADAKLSKKVLKVVKKGAQPPAAPRPKFHARTGLYAQP
jgi:hypothetical protein